MKISILSADLSSNCLGRAYLLAKILQRHYEVEIIGPIFGEGIWKPIVNDKSIIYKSVKINGLFKPYWQIMELVKKIDGDVIYASKPLFTSFGIGLLKKFFKKKPLLLDIDDWQLGFRKEYYSKLSFYHRLDFLASSILYLYDMGSYLNDLICEKLACFANGITVSNNFLKVKFGGTIVCHGRNTEAFNPQKFDKNLIKEKYEIEKTKMIVMFFGTPRPYKGIEDLINAVALIKNQDIILVIVGTDQHSQDFIELAGKMLNQRFKEFGFQPFELVPEFLAMADVIVIPQKRNFATIGQVPAKVYDAMAMAKPIIATDVSDLPEILKDCGWIVEAENPKQLAETIQYVLEHPSEAQEMGSNARQKCIEKYSWDAIEKVLVGMFSKYE